MIDLSGKIAIITGGGGGIGDAVARQFVKLGARVGVAGRRAEVLKLLSQDCDVLPLTCDVSDPRSVDMAISTLVDTFGGLDIIINNAGIAHGGTAEDISLADWQMDLDVNLTGSLNVCKRGVPELKKRSGGAIVNVSSICGLTGALAVVSYSAAKAGMLGLSRSLARDYGKHNIRVNTICPGWVDTPMIQPPLQAFSLLHGVTMQEAKRMLTRWSPLGRMSTPGEVANCITFLASPASSFVSGAILVVDGGQSIVDLASLPMDPDAGIYS
jgi:meso-butanediol dehydrogenase/(S,S)-butanediol dehydrogenase/diacetyl reductase